MAERRASKELWAGSPARATLTQPCYWVKTFEQPSIELVEAEANWCERETFWDMDAEPDKLTPRLRVGVSELEARWQRCAHLEQWEAALEIANAIVILSPDWPNGWVYKASSLNELNRPEAACEILRQAAKRLPTDEIILYDLACVCCVLGRVDEGRGWLDSAIEAGGKETKLRALCDPELEPVRRGLLGARLAE